MKLIVISSDIHIHNEADYIIGLFKCGLEVFHLRKPGATYMEMKNLLLKIPFDFHQRIVIHGQYELLNDFGLKGIHQPEHIRKESLSLPEGITLPISTSFHNFLDINQCNVAYEYVFYSPVFTSISKEEYFPLISLEEIKSKVASAKQNIIALGGVTSLNVELLSGSGFYGVATVGYIWRSADPVMAFVCLKRLVDAINS